MRIVLSCCMLCCLLLTVAASEKAVVTIGNTSLTVKQLQGYSDESNPDPFMLIRSLKLDEAARLLAEKRELRTGDPEAALYYDVTGFELEKDREIDNGRDVPMHMKMPANLRLGIYENWLIANADRIVPVRINDYTALWDMFKKTKSYRDRAEHGHVLKPEMMPYTWADLMVDAGAAMVSRKGKPFITGGDFNAFVKNSPGLLATAAGRGQTVDQAREKVLHGLLSQKLLEERYTEKKLTMDDVAVEQAVDQYAVANMMAPDLTIKGVSAQSYGEFMNELNRKSMQRNAGVLKKLRSVLKSAKKTEELDDELSLIAQAKAAELAKLEMINGIEKKQLLQWIEKNKFKGSRDAARGAMATELQNDQLKKMIDSGELVINFSSQKVAPK